MLTFMDHVQQAFYKASYWDVDNCYDTLTATAKCTLLRCLFSCVNHLI